MYLQFTKIYLVALIIWLSIPINTFAQTKPQAYAQVDSLNKLFSEGKNDFNELHHIAKQALTLSKNAAYTKGEAMALSRLGTVYSRRGNYTQALKQYLSALKLYDQYKLNRTIDFVVLLKNTAIAFLYIEDCKRGLEYGHKAAIIAQELRDKDLLGTAYHIIGNLHIVQKMTDSTTYYHNMARTLFIQTHNLSLLADLYIDMGINYAEHNNIQQSINYTLKAHKLYKQLGRTEKHAIIFNNIGEDYYSLRQYKKALAYLDSAQHYAQQFDRVGDLQYTFPMKAKTYAALGQADSTAHYYEKALRLKDSLYNETYKKELAKLQTELDIHNKETENKLLVKDNRIAILYRNLAIAGALILFATLTFILLQQRLRVQKRVKKQLEQEVAQRTGEIMRQKEAIDQANLRLELALNGAKFDSHFVFNVLNSIQHIIMQKKPLEAQDHVARLARLMRYILEKSALDSVPLKDELNMLEQYIRLEQLRLDYKFNYQIENSASEEILVPALLLQPYIENALLHGLAPANKTDLLLTLKIEKREDKLLITITDNGVGRKRNKLNTHISMGSSMGKERLRLLTQVTNQPHMVSIQDLKTDWGENAGTSVFIQIPIRVQQLEPYHVEV